MKNQDKQPIGVEPERPPTGDSSPQQRTAIEPERIGRRKGRPYKDRSEALPVIVEVGADVIDAATSNIFVDGARAVGHGAMEVGSVGLDVLGSVAEVGGEVLSGAADVVGAAGDGCAGCAGVIVAVPIGLALLSCMTFL